MPLPYDAEIEYLESSGTQYINTEIIQNSLNFEARIIFQWIGSTTSQFESFFAYMSNNGITPRSGFHKYNGKWMFGTNATNVTTTPVDNRKHNVLWASYSNSQKEYLYIDGTKIGEGNTASTGISNNTIPFFLGCRNRKNSVDNSSNIRVMSLHYILYNDNNHNEISQEWNLIPVRIGNTGYMYDKVNSQFFGNAGTGNFILGPDKIS